MSTGQHRRTGEPLKERLTKLMSSATGSHRRRKQATNQPSTGSTITKAEEYTHAGYQNGAIHPGGTAA